MDFLFKLVIVFLLFLFSWFAQEEHQLWDLTRNELKKANNFSAHDAAQQIDMYELANGFLVIDQIKARAEFENTLRLNLGLDENFKPKPGSPIKNEVRIIHFEVVDHRSVTFPYLYVNDTYKISKYLRGPAVIAVIETDYYHLVDFLPLQKPIQVPSISEYVMNK